MLMQRDTCALMFFPVRETARHHAQLPPLPRVDRAGCSPCAGAAARGRGVAPLPPLLVLPRYRFAVVTTGTCWCPCGALGCRRSSTPAMPAARGPSTRGSWTPSRPAASASCCTPSPMRCSPALAFSLCPGGSIRVHGGQTARGNQPGG